MLAPRLSHDSAQDSEAPLLSEQKRETEWESARLSPKSRSWVVIVPWILNGILLVGLIIQGWKIDSLRDPEISKFWAKNEFEVAKREIPDEYVQIKFAGGLRFNESGQLYRELDEDVPDYAGTPTLEIEAAWRDLISTTDIFLTLDEVDANRKQGSTYADISSHDEAFLDQSGLYQAVPVVFHDLHCLDKIRRAVYIEHYRGETDDRFWPHLMHCIDTLRQSIMCHSDLTLIPEVFTHFRPNGHLMPVFQISHTCRDFGAVQRWAKTRDATDENIWRDNAMRLQEDEKQ